MTKEEIQNIKLEKVDDKTAYENLLVKYAELENKIADIKANCDFALEGKDVEIKELKDHLAEEVELHLHAEEYIKSLEKENAELKEKLTAIRNAKDKYDMSKDKSIIRACGAEYYLFCDLERILED